MQENPEEKKYRENVEMIATNIAQLSRQVNALLTGRLNRKAIVTLLVQSCKLPQKTVSDVLDAIVDLEKDYLK